ncbi:type I restriction-modification system subunit M/S [Planococcus shixiaomingii]|uniref:type I restriction-modification system subunit M/S n=1 Tax=Planococcus shixiaomingii TaxID=3058393 RepID=UPI00261CDD2F|nr:type I restriction-modification system subunit M/S [Planococcus sp. N022]WKA53179.1 N-6 DNA methylase [Planococcus sp. N022]
MSNEKSLWTLLDNVRDILIPEDTIELLAISSLLGYLDQHPVYSESFNFKSVLKDSSKVKMNLRSMLEKAEEIPALKGVFPELKVLGKIKSAELSKFLYDFSSITNNSTHYGEWLDQAQQSLGHFRGRGGAEHTSPKTINKIALSMLDPRNGSFYDGVAGLGGGLVEAKKHSDALKVYGQEIDPRTCALSKIRMFLYGIEDADLRQGNVLTAPAFVEGNHVQQFDFVFMDAPFGALLQTNEALANDPYQRFVYGVPSKRSGDLAFISHALASLKEKGKGIVVVIDGTLYRGGADAAIRKNIISSDIIEAVVSLPARLYENTVLPVNIIYFNREKSPNRRGKILFVNAADNFTEEQRQKRVLSYDAIQQITETVKSGQEKKDFSKWILNEDIKDGNLLPSRYLVASEMYIAGHGHVKIFQDKLNNVKTAALKEKADFFTGFNVVSKNKESAEGKYRIIKISDVQDGKLLLDTISRYDIENNARVEKYKLEKGDVILSIRGQALKTAIILEDEENLLLSQNFIGIRCGKQLHPEFLKTYLESPVAQFLLASKLSGTTVPTLSRKDIKELEIPYLPLSEQQAAVEAFKSKTTLIELKLEELQQELKKAKSHVYEQMGIGEAFELTD